MKKEDIDIYWDEEADFLEITFGEPTPSYYEDVGEGILISRDDKTNEVKGYAIFDAINRERKDPEKIPQEIAQSSKKETKVSP